MHFMFLVSFFKPVVLDVFRRFLIFNEYIVLIFFPGVFISEQSAYNVGSDLLAFYSFSQFQVQCLKYEFMPIIGRKKMKIQSWKRWENYARISFLRKLFDIVKVMFFVDITRNI